MNNPDNLFNTGRAAHYLATARGLTNITAAVLRKKRRRGACDGKDTGPEYVVDPDTGFVMYWQSKLDVYTDRYVATLTRARHPQPEHLQQRRSA